MFSSITLIILCKIRCIYSVFGKGNVIPWWINWGDYLNDLDLLFSKRSFWQTADFVAPLIPFGLGMGRIGNFINLELWGRETNVPWAMIFPNDPLLLPRHPSQLYEAFLEGFVLFIILNVFIKSLAQQVL